MKKWSKEWISSKQPRKQRKYRHKAPLHVRHKFISAHLSPDLRRQFSRRSFPIRKGDEVMVTTGQFKGYKGEVTLVNLSTCKVQINGVNVKKVDGSETAKSIEPSNLIITKLNLDDKKRRMSIDRSGKEKPVSKQSKKPEEKPSEKSPSDDKETPKKPVKKTPEKKETKK